MGSVASTITIRCDVRSDVVLAYQTGAKETESDEADARRFKTRR